MGLVAVSIRMYMIADRNPTDLSPIRERLMYAKTKTGLAALAGAATLILTAAPAYAETLSTDQLADVVTSANLPCVSGVAVALAESGGDTDAIGAAGEVGLFQIHPVHGQSGMTDPYANAAYAAELYYSGPNPGWDGDWAAFNNGSYAAYLDEARAACGTTNVGSSSSTSNSTGHSVAASSGYDGTCSREELFWEDCDPADLNGSSSASASGSGSGPVLYYKAGVAIKDLDSDGDGDPVRCGPPALLMYEKCD